MNTARPDTAPAAWPVDPLLSITLLSAASLLCCVLMGVPSVHLISFAREAGFSRATGANLLSVAMIAACVGRIATGMVIDRLDALTQLCNRPGDPDSRVFFFPQFNSLLRSASWPSFTASVSAV